MKILVNDIDISKYLLEYKLTAEMNDDSLIIGNAISKKIVMKMDNQDKFFNTFDALIDYPFTIYNDDVNVTGIFTIYEKPEKYTGELSLSLYDNMYKFSQRYDTKLNYPTTIKHQILEMSTLTGINIDMSGLSEDTLNKQVNWYDNTISMRNYLGWIAELDGCNCFADEQGKIIFRELASNTYKTIDVESYDKSDQVKFTRVCFDDGILKIEEGEETGNTLYISSNNGYIDSNTSLLSIYNKYKDLSFYSVSNVKMANINGWFLTDLINYNDEFIFMPLSINEVYSGGSYAIANVSGTVNLQNNEIIVNKIDLVTKVKRIQTNVDRNSQSLQILAEDLEDGLGKVSDFEIELGKITLSTSNTEKKIETLTNNLNIELSTKLPLNQVYETATKLFVPDYTKQNQTITATVKLLDGTNITNQCTYVWKRKTSSGVETDLVDGEAFSSNILTISNNVLSDDNPIEYICYAHFNDNEAHASITIGLNIIGQDGESVKGEDGKTYYIHIRYSNDGGTTFTSNGGLVAGAWLGQYTDENETASNDVTRYTWSQIKGDKGDTGAKGDKGDTGVSVSSVVVEYYLSTSNTSQSGGSWSTTVPTWEDGKYIWSRQKTTLSNNTTKTTDPVCITGGKGSTGATGTGITSITTEYYLSTSKTSQSGGSWTTTQPTWTTGKYLWTRSKIVYKNPTSTAYTTPVCDSSWEAVNEIQIGARNLLVYSNKAVYSKDDWSGWFTPTANTDNSCGLSGQGIIFPSDTKVGDTFTLSYDIEWTQFTASSSGTFTAPYCQFYANGSWSSEITNPIGSFGISSAVARAEDGILRLSKTFTITAENQIGANFYYNWRTNYSNGTGKFRIRRMKLEKGNKATDWTPAPEDTISSKIVPTTDTFISSKREDGTFSTTPNTIMLSYELYNCSYAGWYYSSDGIGYTKVTSGQNGLTINSENNLIITNNSSLFDSYKSIVFKLTTDIATCQDTITITKSVDATYLYEEIGDIKNEITKVEQIANSAEQKIDSLNGVIEDKITQTTSTLIDNRLVSVNQQITKFQETINGLDIETVQRKTDELGNVLDNYSEYIHIGGGTLELGKSNSNIKTVITNDKFAIQQDGVDIAYVSAHKLFIESALILTDITVGNDTHGYYRWGLRSNGNYSLIYKKGV